MPYFARRCFQEAGKTEKMGNDGKRWEKIRKLKIDNFSTMVITIMNTSDLSLLGP